MVRIVQLCDGVYHDKDVALGPEMHEHEGRVLHRFMDKFYIRCGTEELTSVEVSALCRARAMNPSTILGTNSVVRELFKALIFKRNPKRLLEIGAGTNPILHGGDLHFEEERLLYFKYDADPDSAAGLNAFSESNSELPHESDYFDMAVAIFVLHFHFYTQQIVELHRCLAPSGVFIANVYRRTPESLGGLAQSFTEAGFFVEKLRDPCGLCHDHQYWAISKERDAAARALSELEVIASDLCA